MFEQNYSHVLNLRQRNIRMNRDWISDRNKIIMNPNRNSQKPSRFLYHFGRKVRSIWDCKKLSYLSMDSGKQHASHSTCTYMRVWWEGERNADKFHKALKRMNRQGRLQYFGGIEVEQGRVYVTHGLAGPNKIVKVNENWLFEMKNRYSEFSQKIFEFLGMISKMLKN